MPALSTNQPPPMVIGWSFAACPVLTLLMVAVLVMFSGLACSSSSSAQPTAPSPSVPSPSVPSPSVPSPATDEPIAELLAALGRSLAQSSGRIERHTSLGVGALGGAQMEATMITTLEWADGRGLRTSRLDAEGSLTQRLGVAELITARRRQAEADDRELDSVGLTSELRLVELAVDDLLRTVTLAPVGEGRFEGDQLDGLASLRAAVQLRAGLLVSVSLEFGSLEFGSLEFGPAGAGGRDLWLFSGG